MSFNALSLTIAISYVLEPQRTAVYQTIVDIVHDEELVYDKSVPSLKCLKYFFLKNDSKYF